MAIEKHLAQGETIVVRTRTHSKALILPLITLVVLLAIGAAVQVYVDVRYVPLAVWILLAVAALWYVLRPWLVWFSAVYAFTDRRVITRTGVLTRRGHDIPLSRISDVQIEQQLLDRMLGCGTLIISDASESAPPTLPDVPHVEDVQRRLNDLLHTVHGGGPAHAGRDEGA
ncbi:PH domain-containing protein [Nocardioides sp. TRM66260-LWL]|uniref:PH domain-containing protein n=1 Tax=Nocardioides sp. TRM66260-LWL TaxID=2874478 RepID=UPI001CC42D8C|nr:PH domain-containing protein [Nocardioides sp. TRM66260-LWL]MBZ5733295.1 PH domain-containing protein [Nocardioides sp. TRM66260-LWL]